MVKGSGPHSSGPVADQCIGVVVAEAVFSGEVGVLLVFGSGGMEAVDALVFGSDPDVIMGVAAERSDEAALRVGVPGNSRSEGVSRAKTRTERQQCKTDDQARKERQLHMAFDNPAPINRCGLQIRSTTVRSATLRE